MRVYDATGRYLEERAAGLSRLGLHAISQIAFGSNRLFVVDRAGTRLSVIDSVGVVVRQQDVPVNIYRLIAGTRSDALLQGPGTGEQTIGFLVHRVDSAGRIVSLAEVDGAFVAGAVEDMRVMAASRGAVWLAGITGGELARWLENGSRDQSVRSINAMIDDPRRPQGRAWLAEMFEDRAKRLWLVSSQETRSPSRRTSEELVSREPMGSVTTTIQVLDPLNGKLVAKESFQGQPFRFVGEGTAFRRESNDDFIAIAILRIAMER